MQYVDQLGRTIEIAAFPNKIISLVPSQTELLCDFGLREKIAGITKFCVYPIDLKKEKTIVGGTKNIRIETVINLQPDLIIANKEENEKEQIEQLAQKFPVWVSDVQTYTDAIDMINALGIITNSHSASEKIIAEIEQQKSEYNANLISGIKKVLYLIWKDPFITVGCDTFINDMLLQCGFANVCGNRIRYPEITLEEIKNIQPDIILLSSEPYPFKVTHVNELKEALPETKILLVDGEMFSWYGSRLQYCWKYFIGLQQQV